MKGVHGLINKIMSMDMVKCLDFVNISALYSTYWHFRQAVITKHVSADLLTVTSLAALIQELALDKWFVGFRLYQTETLIKRRQILLSPNQNQSKDLAAAGTQFLIC